MNIHNHRPLLLTSLCILTFSGSTIAFLGYFLAAVLYPKSLEIIARFSSFRDVESIPSYYFTLFMLMYAFSLTGAIRMWKFRRDGFYFYSISQTVILFTPALQFDWHSVSMLNAVFTLLFIGGYLMNYKLLKR
jgi:hypothetical protein